MALSSKLTKADCQFLALLVLHTVVVQGHEVAFKVFAFLKHREVQEEIEKLVGVAAEVWLRKRDWLTQLKQRAAKIELREAKKFKALCEQKHLFGTK
jgi:hypothetical protein